MAATVTAICFILEGKVVNFFWKWGGKWRGKLIVGASLADALPGGKMDRFKNANLGWSGSVKSGLIGAANRNSFVSEIEQKGKSFNPLFDS